MFQLLLGTSCLLPLWILTGIQLGELRALRFRSRLVAVLCLPWPGWWPVICVAVACLGEHWILTVNCMQSIVYICARLGSPCGQQLGLFCHLLYPRYLAQWLAPSVCPVDTWWLTASGYPASKQCGCGCDPGLSRSQVQAFSMMSCYSMQCGAPLGFLCFLLTVEFLLVFCFDNLMTF